MRYLIIALLLVGAITAADLSGLFTYEHAAKAAACIARNVDTENLRVLSVCF
jgi:hypothetical protein